jgi:hypothetical protein
MKYKIILLALIIVSLTGCNDSKNIDKSVENEVVQSTDNFTPLTKTENDIIDNIDDSVIKDNVEDLNNYIDENKDDTVDEMSYQEYLYTISDVVSTDIDNTETDTEFNYDLSSIAEDEIKDTIKALYFKENASSLEIVKYYEEYAYDEVQAVICVVKLDETYHIITLEDGVAYSIKNISDLYDPSSMEEGE